jgi:hypothetical protein
MKRLVCYIVNMRWVGYATGHMEVKLACGQAPRFTTEATHKVTCPKCLFARVCCSDVSTRQPNTGK